MNEVAGFPVSARRRRYSREEREAIVEMARRMRAEGMTMAAVVSEVGVASHYLADIALSDPRYPRRNILLLEIQPSDLVGDRHGQLHLEIALLGPRLPFKGIIARLQDRASLKFVVGKGSACGGFGFCPILGIQRFGNHLVSPIRPSSSDAHPFCHSLWPLVSWRLNEFGHLAELLHRGSRNRSNRRGSR